jgi:hypothetical protein
MCSRHSSRWSEDIYGAVAQRAGRSSRRLERWLRHRLPDGELHGARGGAASPAGGSRLGTSKARVCMALRSCTSCCSEESALHDVQTR